MSRSHSSASVRLSTKSSQSRTKKSKGRTDSSDASSKSVMVASDSDIHRSNQQYWKKYERDVASKVWKLAKQMGITGGEDDSAYIKEIQKMEDRDCQAKAERRRQEPVP